MDKLRFLITSFIISVLFIASGCNKDSTDSILGSCSGKFNGTSWESVVHVANYYQTTGSIVLAASTSITSTENILSVQVLKYVPGTSTYTYGINSLSVSAPIIYKKTATSVESAADYYMPISTSVTITKLDLTNKRISGTFTATLRPSNAPLVTTNDLVITSGTFTNVNLVVE
jgi:hypothetical protein